MPVETHNQHKILLPIVRLEQRTDDLPQSAQTGSEAKPRFSTQKVAGTGIEI
jgi:hypothetical protein